MVIDQTNKEEVLKVFKAVYEIKHEIKLKNSAASDLLKTLSEKLNINKAVVTMSYQDWVKAIEKPREKQESEILIESIK